MDEGLQTLAALAEHVVVKKLDGIFNPAEADADRGWLPRDWTPVFVGANVCREKLVDKNAKGRDTWVGTFLSGKTDRSVSITVGQRSGNAILCRNPVRNDQKRTLQGRLGQPLADCPHAAECRAAWRSGYCDHHAGTAPVTPAPSSSATDSEAHSDTTPTDHAPPPPGADLDETGNWEDWV